MKCLGIGTGRYQWNKIMRLQWCVSIHTFKKLKNLSKHKLHVAYRTFEPQQISSFSCLQNSLSDIVFHIWMSFPCFSIFQVRLCVPFEFLFINWNPLSPTSSFIVLVGEKTVSYSRIFPTSAFEAHLPQQVDACHSAYAALFFKELKFLCATSNQIRSGPRQLKAEKIAKELQRLQLKLSVVKYFYEVERGEANFISFQMSCIAFLKTTSWFWENFRREVESFTFTIIREGFGAKDWWG